VPTSAGLGSGGNSDPLSVFLGAEAVGTHGPVFSDVGMLWLRSRIIRVQSWTVMVTETPPDRRRRPASESDSRAEDSEHRVPPRARGDLRVGDSRVVNERHSINEKYLELGRLVGGGWVNEGNWRRPSRP
jgi:hypothetical protein